MSCVKPRNERIFTAVLHAPSFIAGQEPSQLSETGQFTCSLASRSALISLMCAAAVTGIVAA